MKKKANNLMTVAQTAEFLNMPVPTVYYLIGKKEIPAVRIGGRWRIQKSALVRKYKLEKVS